MNKRKQAMASTDSYQEFKLIRYSIILGCPLCGPNSGCNAAYKRRRGKPENWKRSRRTQYKTKSPALQ